MTINKEDYEVKTNMLWWQKGEESLLMRVLEVYDGKCLVEDLINMSILPTHIYKVDELKVVSIS